MNELQNLATVRTLLLQRVAAGMVQDVDRLLLDIAEQIKAELIGGKPLVDLRKKQIDGIIAGLLALVGLTPPDIANLAGIEAKGVAIDMAAVGIEARLPPMPALEKIAGAALVEGATVKDWFDSINQQLRFDIERTLRGGVAQGRTNLELIEDLTGAMTQGKFGPHPLKKAMRDAEAVVRTGVQTVANDAALAVYQENRDVIKALKYVATLDSRTTIKCAALDGKMWTVDGEPIKGNKLPFTKPPSHWQCRSTLIPVTSLSDINPSTRASMGGQISGKIDFEQFMDSKGADFAAGILGKGRYELYKSNSLTLTQLLDPRTLEPLTLAQLEAKYGY